MPADRTAMGSGANNTARYYLGSALGIAACSVIVNHAGADAGPAGITSGWNAAATLTAVVSLTGALVVAVVRDRPTAADPSTTAGSPCTPPGPG